MSIAESMVPYSGTKPKAVVSGELLVSITEISEIDTSTVFRHLVPEPKIVYHLHHVFINFVFRSNKMPIFLWSAILRLTDTGSSRLIDIIKKMTTFQELETLI